MANEEADQIFKRDEGVKNISEKGEIDFKKIPEDEYLCPYCGEIPEILEIHTDNSKIKFNCIKCGIGEISIREFLESIKLKKNNYLNTKCSSCLKKKFDSEDKENNDDYLYCYDCQKDFCKNCFDKHSKSHYKIKVKEKRVKCLKHYGEEITQYCKNCLDNVCNKEKTNIHKDHEIKNFIDLNKNFIYYKKVIEEKNKFLSNLIKFNRIILNAGETLNENYFHLKNVIELGKLIDEENKRDSNNNESFFLDLNESIKIWKEIEEKLKNKEIFLKRDELFLHLEGRNLENEDLQLISKIRFNQLKDINLSKNNIKDIEFLNRMQLPFLEYINLSENEIENIEPIANLNSRKLKEIFLQVNKIKNIDAFLEPKFGDINILRLEDNQINIKEDDPNNKNFKIILKKFKNKIKYKTIKEEIKEFNEKYSAKIESEKDKKIFLEDRLGGEEMLRDLYIIITYHTKNEIQVLNLMNNAIKDPSILKRVNFSCLTTFDLAVNEITNLIFLEQMKLKNLKKLYLNDNKISDISPLLKLELEHLTLLTLENNNLDVEEIKNSGNYKKIVKKNGLDIIQFEKQDS